MSQKEDQMLREKKEEKLKEYYNKVKEAEMYLEKARTAFIVSADILEYTAEEVNKVIGAIVMTVPPKKEVKEPVED